MPYSFDWVCKDVVKKLQGKDLRPVKCLSDAKKFRQFEILQKTAQSLFWKSEDIPVGYSLKQILEPNFPVPEPDVSAPIPLKHTTSQKLKANVGVNAIAEGSVSAEFVQSCGYDIEVQCTSIPDSKLESLQNRKMLDQEPSFVKDCRMGRKDLYVVTEAYEVTKDTVLEDSSSVELSGKVGISQVAKGQAQGQLERKTTDSVSIPKGSIVAYKKKQLVIENDTCAILLSANAKKKTFLGMLPRLIGGFAASAERVGCRSETIEIGPHSTRQLGRKINYISPIGRIEEAFHLDFKCLHNEVSRRTKTLAMLSKDVQDVVFSSLLPMLSDREILYDLMNMLELDQLGHMDGPGGVILDELRQDSIPPWIDLKNLILYLLQALMVLSDTQLNLLAQSMEKKLLLQQRELVKSILQPNFKYPWNIPFTLQPQLLAPLQGEGLVITYELLKECGLKMELNNPRKLLDKEPSFVKDCWKERKDLYVVTEAFEVTKVTMLEDSSSVDLSGKVVIPQVAKVKSILQLNFKYHWNIPFTLQPQLLAPLQGEVLVITYKLLKECGLKMELNNPRSTWDLEAKMPLSALYGSLSFLQQPVEA